MTPKNIILILVSSTYITCIRYCVICNSKHHHTQTDFITEIVFEIDDDSICVTVRSSKIKDWQRSSSYVCLISNISPYRACWLMHNTMYTYWWKASYFWHLQIIPINSCSYCSNNNFKIKFKIFKFNLILATTNII